MSGNLIPRDGDDPEDHFELIDVPDEHEAHEVIERRTADARNKLSQYIPEDEEDVIEGEFELKRPAKIENNDDILSRVEPLNMSAPELEFFRDELKRVQPHISAALNAVGQLVRNPNGNNAEDIKAALADAVGDIMSFVDHVRQDDGFLQAIASRLPLGIDLAESLEQLPHDFAERATNAIPNTIDLLCVREALTKLQITTRVIDVILPKRPGQSMDPESLIEAKLMRMLGPVDLTMPGVRRGAVDMFEYELARDGLEHAEKAAHALIADPSDIHSLLALEAFYGIYAHEGVSGSEVQDALITLGRGDPSFHLSRDLENAPENQLHEAARNSGDMRIVARAATSSLKDILLLKKYLRPRLDFLAKQMPRPEAVGPLTRAVDAVKSFLRLS